MNKFLLFLCFLLAIGFTQSEVIDEIDVTDVFEKFLKISKGLTNNTEYKCTKILTNNKARLIRALEDMIRNKKDLLPTLIGVAAQLIFFADGFSNNCNIGPNFDIVKEITKATGIRKMGQNMIDNATELEGLFNELQNATNNDDRLMIIGKIIRKITGITFQ